MKDSQILEAKLDKVRKEIKDKLLAEVRRIKRLKKKSAGFIMLPNPLTVEGTDDPTTDVVGIGMDLKTLAMEFFHNTYTDNFDDILTERGMLFILDQLQELTEASEIEIVKEDEIV